MKLWLGYIWRKLKISIGLRGFQTLFNKADFLCEVFLGQMATFYCYYKAKKIFPIFAPA